MPDLGGLPISNTVTVLLNRSFGGLPPKLRNYPLTGLFVNFCRLTDKALREYQAARTDLLTYAANNATYRAVLNSEALRHNNIGRGAPRLTDKQRACLKAVRDPIEHSDERLLIKSKNPSRPQFQPGQPFSLFVTNTQVAIGPHTPATASTGSAGGTFISDHLKQLWRASLTH